MRFPFVRPMPLVLLVLALAGCKAEKQASPGDGNNSADKEGFWVASLGDGQVVPWRNGEHAWMYDEARLWRVNPKGEKKAVDDLPRGDAIYLVKARDDGGAWVVTGKQDRSLYLVDQEGKASRWAVPLTQALQVDVVSAEWGSAWVVVVKREGSELYHLRPSKHEPSGPALKRAGESITRCRPDEDGSAWVMTASISDQITDPRLYHVRVSEDGSPRSRRVLARPGPTDPVKLMDDPETTPRPTPLFIDGFVPAGAAAAWVAPREGGPGGIFHVSAADSSPQARQFLANRKVSILNLFVEDDGKRRAWVSPSGQPGLQLIDPQTGPIGKPLDGETVRNNDLYSPVSLAPQRWLWLQTEGNKLYILPPGKEEPIRQSGPLAGWTDLKLVPAADRRAWVWSKTASGLYLIDGDGKASAYPALADVRILDLVPAGDEKGNAWVLTDNPRKVLLVPARPGTGPLAQEVVAKARRLVAPFPGSSLAGVQVRTDQVVLVAPELWGKQNRTPLTAPVSALSAGADALQHEVLGNRTLLTGPVSAICTVGQGRAGWLQARTDEEGEVFVLGTAEGLNEPAVIFEDKTAVLKADDNQGSLQVDPWRRGFEVTVKPGWSGGVSLKVTATFTLYDETGVAVATANSKRFDLAELKEVPMPLHWEQPAERAWGQPHSARLVLRADNGSDLHVSWKRVTFSPPEALLQQKWLRSLGVCVLLTMLVAVVALAVRRWESVSRWALLAWLALGGLSGGLLGALPHAEDVNVSGPWLLFYLVVLFVVCLVAGLIRPEVFREMARNIPFNYLAPLTLHLPRVRQRMFGEYVDHLEGEVERKRQDGNHEKYVELPAQVQLWQDGKEGPERLEVHPADFILDQLLKPRSEERCHVYVEATGGVGKSALLREVVMRALERFRQDQRTPLPVWVTPAREEIKTRIDKWLQERIDEALGRHSFSDEALGPQLKAGDFFVVLDGLHEFPLKPEQLRGFVEGVYGQKVRLLVASRPHPDFRNALRSSDRLLGVVPQPLSEDAVNGQEPTLMVFQREYLKVDEELHKQGKLQGADLALLSDELKELCRSGKTYSPLRVRLAIRMGQKKPKTVAELYEDTFRMLLGGEKKEADSWRRKAAELCVDTYWATGKPNLEYANAPEKHLGVLEKLLDAGILVPADPRQHRVRFFHDSMQSCLTAWGLLQGLAVGADSKPLAVGRILACSAGDPRFGSRGAELFEMCLVTYDPNDLRQTLKEELGRWARQHHGELRTDDLLQAPADNLKADLAGRVPSGVGAQMVLEEAIALSDGSADDQEAVIRLGVLFRRVTPLVWPYLEDA